MRVMLVIILALTISLVNPGSYVLATEGGGDGGEGGESNIFPSQTGHPGTPGGEVRVSFTGSNGKHVVPTLGEVNLALLLSQRYLEKPLASYLPPADELKDEGFDHWIGKLAVRLILQDFLVNPDKPLKKIVEDNVCVAMFIAFMTVQVKHAR